MNIHINLSRDDHLFQPGSKRILALDGGGLRGIVALAFLERIEHLLAESSGRGEAFRLCDHYDLIGGTSTGAVIASGLALGMPVAQLIDIYIRLSHEGFQGMRWHGGVWLPKFRTAPLLKVLRQYLAGVTLGSDQLRTGLAIIAKRLDTGSPWVFHNNPHGPYFDPDRALHPNAVPNKDFELVDLIRASTAAPTFFEPEVIDIGQGMKGTFVDGGTSPYNNPALILLLVATVQGYGFGWPVGVGRLQLTSVGTGHKPLSFEAEKLAQQPGALLGVQALLSLMGDCNWLTQALLQWLSHCPTPWPIDREMGDLSQDQLGNGPFLHYLRYDVELTAESLKTQLGVTLSVAEVERLNQMDRPDLVERLLEIGRLAAERSVRVGDLGVV
ncbi:MAG: patatin-like phospholipase family protein [Candidatus Competibacteraceae bacterium]|nr:patatin-like phospholipase family protein [Candidatus Competibacteraceae bacterium]